MVEKREIKSDKQTTTVKNKKKNPNPIEETKDVLFDVPTDKNSKKVKFASEETKVLTELREKETIDTINITVNDDIEIEEKKPIIEEKEPEIIRYYDTKIKEGLNEEIVAKRKEQGLANIASSNKGKSIFAIIASNVFTFFNILYLIIAIILIIFKSPENMIGFVPVIFSNLIIGIIQEIKAKRTIEKMALMSAPTATVIRNGVKLEVPIQEVVLDDIIFFTPGKQICTDSIILEGTVEVNESLLTGEADSIVKTTKDELLSGSFIVSGVCVARVDRVGDENYIEKVASDAKKYNPPKSELLRTLRGIIRVIAIVIFPISILYLMANGNIFSGDVTLEQLSEQIKNVAYIILAMIPAGLFLLTTMALATGVIRLAKNKTLVQELYCIEMLARVDVLCLDKTGTITDGTMRVCDSVEVKNHTDYTIREIVGSMMSAFEDSNPTSEALIKFFDKNKVLTPIEIIPFSSIIKYSAVTFEEEGTFILGAPEFVLTAPEQYEKVRIKVDRFASQGCRVIILGQTNSRIKGNVLPKTVRPIAIIVIQDHIREDAESTIDFFKNNGVDIKVISGDNPETVSQIAKRVGIEGAERYISLHNLTDEEVRDCVFDYTVFGRVSPKQKRILIQALKAHKKTVAMTGDGVNDILALKEADCSIAMASGSEAARYVSHLVLMDSNFASMPKVVREGRRVINNIQKTSSLYLTKNLFAILLAIMYIIIGFTTKNNGQAQLGWPYQARHLLLIEWFILGFATFALALQPNNEIIKGKFLKNVIKDILPGALTILFFNLILYLMKNLEGFATLQNKEVFATIGSLVTTAIMWFVLLEASRPFNWFRKIVFSIVTIAVISSLLIKPDMFLVDFTQLAIVDWLVFIVMLQAIYPMMKLISLVLVKLRIIKN